MSNPYLLTDVDGVLLDWYTPFYDYMSRIKVPIEGAVHLDHRKMEKLWYNTDWQDIDVAIRNFNQSKIFSDLKPLRHAEKYLPLLKEQGFDIVAITASNTDKISTSLRQQNLEKVFGNVLSDILYVERLASKKEILAKFPPSYWVEDYFPNAAIGFEVGHSPILISHTYNEQDWDNPIVEVVENWKNIYDFRQ